jgi:hypothetical protein
MSAPSGTRNAQRHTPVFKGLETAYTATLCSGLERMHLDVPPSTGKHEVLDLDIHYLWFFLH